MRPHPLIVAVLAILAVAALCAAAGPPAADGDDFFTIVHLSDTQYYSEKFPGTFMQVTAWIRDNAAKERVAFVTHTGDLVQSGAAGGAEWDAADRAMSALDGKVRWGTAPGNHDYDTVSGAVAAATTFITRFGPARFRKAPWYGGHSDNGLNSYQLVEGAGAKLMVLHLEADAPDAALAWAAAALARHPDRQAIVATHIYLHDRRESRGKAAYFRKGGNAGEQIWEKLVRTHPQVFMVLSGHWASATGEWRQTSVNAAGRKVHEMIANYQRRPGGGDGLVRLLRFFPTSRRIEVRTYSVTRNAFEEGPASRFDLAWE